MLHLLLPLLKHLLGVREEVRDEYVSLIVHRVLLTVYVEVHLVYSRYHAR